MNMGAHGVSEVSLSLDDIYTVDCETESSRNDLVVETSSNGELVGEFITMGEILTSLELDLAYASEKLINLSILMMHVATRESDFEAFASGDGDASVGSAQKAMEFNLLVGILEAEVMELDKFITTLQTDDADVGKRISSCEHLGETIMVLEEKLHDSEKALKQLQDQVSEIREQSAMFRRILSFLDGDEKRNDNESSNFLEDVNINSKINMQTAEQQRHILRMLEKSLAKEMDLEKKLSDSKQIEEELKHKLLSMEQEIYFIEEEAVDACVRQFEAENASEVLMGISKELLARIKIFQFNLNGAIQREADLKSKLEDSNEQLEAKESALQKLNSSSAKLNDFLLAQTESLKSRLTEAENKLIVVDSEAFTLREKVSMLENQLRESEIQLLNAKVSAGGNEDQCSSLRSEVTDMESIIEDLTERLSKAESRAENAESKCKLLAGTNRELNEELGHLKGMSEKVDLLEKKLRERDIRLQHELASAEASQEKQSMLYLTIKDMENLIEGLKFKASKAESRADSAEDKCIILSESNAELNEELSFLRGRLECLEASLNQAEEIKMATAKDIGFRTKVITDLLMQLAIERERLHKQTSLLAVENRNLLIKVQHASKDPSVQISTNGSMRDKIQMSVPVDEAVVAPTDSTSELEGVRRIDAGVLGFKHFFMALLILLISAVANLYQPQNALRELE